MPSGSSFIMNRQSECGIDCLMKLNTCISQNVLQISPKKNYILNNIKVSFHPATLAPKPTNKTTDSSRPWSNMSPDGWHLKYKCVYLTAREMPQICGSWEIWTEWSFTRPPTNLKMFGSSVEMLNLLWAETLFYMTWPPVKVLCVET